MRFPVDITFKLLNWRAHAQMTDAEGQTIGYVPPLRKGLLDVPVYADKGTASPIYRIKAEHMFTHWFEDGKGRRLGEYGITAAGGMGGGKLVFVDTEPRFRLVCESEWVDFMDRMAPNLPFVNGLTGLLVRPRTKAIRLTTNAEAFRIVKNRLMIDVSYRLHALEDIPDTERECLMLTALLHAFIDISRQQT